MMNKWFKLWFIPIILLGMVIGVLFIDVPSKFTSFSAKKQEPFIPEDELVRDKDGNIYGRKMPDGMIYLLPDPSIYVKTKNKFSYVIENPINSSVLSGAVIGWIICKILDSGLTIFMKRIRKK